MSLYDTFKADSEMESGTGIWLDYGDGGQINIRRAGGSNKRYGAVLAAKMKPYQRQLQNGTMDDEVSRRILAEVYASTVIVGWKGVDGPNGKTLACTEENVVRVLLDLPDLFRDIQDQANSLANFRAEQAEADAKN